MQALLGGESRPAWPRRRSEDASMKAPHGSEFAATAHDPGLHGGGTAFDAIVRRRRTLRAFRPLAVAREIANEILEVAACSPSTFNTQPWRVHLICRPARPPIVDATGPKRSRRSSKSARTPTPCLG